jgi:hypothetical protein
MSHSVFVARRLVCGAFSVAFASSLAQAEMFTGSCGIMANAAMHIASLCIGVTGLLISILGCVAQRAFAFDKHILKALSLMHTCYCLLQFGELLLVDRMLIEVGFLLGFLEHADTPIRFFVCRALLGAWLGKISICGTSWTNFSVLKSDALNQPFPFTPVWHLAQIPDRIVSILSAVIFVSELLLPILIASTRSAGPLLCTLFLSIYYAVLGNFGWSVTVLVACVFYLLPSILVSGIVGETTLVRWGYTKQPSAVTNNAEQEILHAINEFLFTSGFIFAIAGGLIIYPTFSVSITSLIGISALVFCTLFTLFKLRRSYMSLIFVACGVLLSRTEFVSIITGGFLPAHEDFSALPTCFTFEGGSHNKSARSVFLLQTKYSVIGTNTVGSNLGGSRYAELSVPGSVHGDEARPAFLLGHVPRLALKLWGIGTGRQDKVADGLRLMKRLETMVEKGSDGIKVMFSGADDSVLSALVGKSNQVQSFVQSYQVTERVADHQWWKRNYQGVAALPTNTVPSAAVPVRCSPIVPAKLFGMGLDMILPSAVLGLVVLKLLFGSGGRSKSRSQKDKSR